MSFRKRNVVIGSSSGASTSIARQEKSLAPGTRPSPLDGRLTTSTGTQSLDQLLAGHAGMPMGTSLLIEETGTTDFGGVLLRYYAAEGLVQGHQVHLLGFGDGWRRELPGTGRQANSRSSKTTSSSDEKMKIAWRYETLGQRSVPTRDPQASLGPGQGTAPFCHTFDLSKRLESNAIQGEFHASPIDGLLASPSQAPFKKFISDITSKIKSSTPSTVHRIIVPSLLSPTLYSSAASQPREVLQFLHALRALLRQFPTQTTALLTLPITLFQRSSGLTRWMELLSDGVLELIPLQHQGPVAREPGGEDKGQGMLRTHSLPVFHEKGGGIEGTWARENLSFRLSSSGGLVIEPFSLPPDTMAASTASNPVRISKIAGRFLIFDADSAALLRRNENVNGTLTGTAPQQPTQNIFLGLPVELRPEEAEALVSRKVAYLVDVVAAHQSVLRNPDPDARNAYLDSLKTRKQTAQRVFAEQSAKRAAEVAGRHGAPASRSKKSPPTNADDDALFSSNPSEPSSRLADGATKSLGVTPTSSSCLISQEIARIFRAENPTESPLCRFLLSSGYYMTPGLRFGAKYSVYPGDPLRFHAHFMASQYDWDEEIPILDIVAGGRLATAVKKAFLIGGQEPGLEASSDRQVRTFSLEWAAM
ncbi:PAXNEB protein-domain-containing protein [Dactylonectria macrodidyma]|uniref:Elongator complex protein 4 n=1 Tax=Dactylonectria macrodidyma TaxID=307937 RepID=A0A9P9JM17_9HYPO|nr:PAXNEB protein-domain-containing protein [Dactylonectria macrodidyma]